MKAAALNTLIAARKLIEDPANWTQGAMARTERGWQVEPDAYGVSSWCALGAIHREAPTGAALDLATRALNNTAIELGFGSIILINDAFKHRANREKAKAHAATLMVFDLAIAKALS
jgi:hypothetical protein